MKSNVIQITQNLPHISGHAKCMDCGHEWVAVAPVGVCIMECPKCETMRGVWKYDISVDDDYWACNCGNKLFAVTLNGGLLCPKCGIWQEVE